MSYMEGDDVGTYLRIRKVSIDGKVSKPITISKIDSGRGTGVPQLEILDDEIFIVWTVFDYENNRNYRFLIVNDKQIKMIDKNAKLVKGFKLSKTKNKIINPIKHFRIKGKDYIVVQESNGKINICLLYTSPSPRDRTRSRMPSSA